MNKGLKNALIVAGLLSVISIPQAKADNRLIMNGNETVNTGLSNITTTDSGNGGAILNNDGYALNITGGNYSNNILESSNQAVFGGAIYQVSGTLNISDGITFDGNVVRSVQQTYLGWEGIDGPAGGAIYLNGTSTVIGNVIFNNNRAEVLSSSKESNGGALFIQGAPTVTMGNVTFTSNASATRGGAVYNGDSLVDIQGSANFNGNQSGSGGAIYMYDVTGTTVTNTGTGSIFENNKAVLKNGGAIANYDGTLHVGKNNTFINNSAVMNGGAIYNANFDRKATTTVSGGTSFTKNSAVQNGGAIYNSGKVTLNTTDGNITFSENKASVQGSDVYLDGTGSELVITGSNASNKVSFSSADNGSIAGNGKITNASSGTVEFNNNKDVDGFTGEYLQTSGITTLNNSSMFNKFEINAGQFNILNGSTATVDGTNGKIGNAIGLTVNGADSILNIKKITVGADAQVNILGGGQVNLSDNAKLTLNSAVTRDAINNGDTWTGNINTTSGGNLTLDGFTHNTGAGAGNYTQNGGSLVLNNGSELTLGNADSKITGGTVTVNTGNTINIEGGSVIGGNAVSNIAGDMNINNGGAITGGTTNVQSGGNIEINNGGSITGGTTNVQNGGNVDVNNGGSISGGTTNVKNGANVNVNNGGEISGNANTNIESGAKVTVDGGKIDTTGKTDIKTGSEIEIKNNGEVNLHEGDKWNGKITNNDSTLNLDKITHDTKDGQYIQTGGELNLNNGSDLTIGTGSSITNGEVNVDKSDLTVDNGGTISGGNVTVGNDSSFNVNEGGTISGGKIDFTGDNISIGINGTVLADAIFDVTKNTVEITSKGSVTLNKDAVTGDLWTDGTIHLNGGSLNFEGTNNNANGTFLGDSGKINISSGSQHFAVDTDSYIKAEVETTIDAGSSLDITGGDVTLNDNDTWNGHVNISSGELNLNNAVKDAGGKITQTGGTTNVGGSFTMNNSNDLISGGILNIGKTGTGAILNQDAGVIEENASVNIYGDSTLNVNGGTTTINTNGTGADIWQGKVQLNDGTLNLTNVTNNGTLQADGGSLNIDGLSDLIIANNSYIKENTSWDLAQDGNISIKNNGSVSFGDDDSWHGSVTLQDGGNLNYSSTTGQDGIFLGQGGNLTTTDGSLIEIKAGSFIDEAVNADIAGKMFISGNDADNKGRVDLSTGDKVTGNIEIGDYGTLNFGDNVVMADNGQEIRFDAANAEMNLIGNNNLDLKAEIAGNSGQINKEGSGNILFSGGTSNYKGDLTINNSGNLIFTDTEGFGGNLMFGNITGDKIGIIADKIKGAINQNQDAEITYSTYRDVALNFDDKVTVSAGSLIAKARDGQDVNFGSDVAVTNGSSIQVYGSKDVNFNGPVSLTGIDNDNKALITASGKKVTFNDALTAENSIIITNANETILNGITDFNNTFFHTAQGGFNAQDLSMAGNSTINLMNGTLANGTIDNMSLSDGSVTNLAIDISARDWASDKIIAGSVSANGIPTLNVSDFQFINLCPIDRHIALKLFDTETPMDDILFTAGDKEVFTPIGYYRMFSQGGGNYTASLTRYNPQVFRGQVATVASFQNQLVVNNMLFSHIQEVSMQYLAQKDGNKYAAAYPQFAPYQYNKNEGSLWFKTFGTFERLGMTQGLNVNNNFYGALVGADFAAIDLGKGWSLLPTAYVGYTGGHQTYANMSMTQNGGQGGVMGTFMKNDFIGSIMAYGGGYGNQMDVAGHTDSTGNWFVGTAAKAAYNFHPSKHFIIQPTALVSYNLFGEQNWYTGFGAMNMQSGMLNGINVAPGVNFIYGRETWSIYATVQYFYNIMGYSEGQAGNVSLPGISMRHGFLEYGLGFTKTWKERFSGYLQVVLRNGGRTGVGFQGGLMYRI